MNDGDFFDDLERELVAAASDRTRRLRRARARRTGAATGAAVAVLALGGGIAAAVTSSGGGDGENRAAASVSTPTTTVPSSTTPANALPRPGSFEVAVLNGTSVPGLARGVANRLQDEHHKIGTVTNAATQTVAVSIVTYRDASCRAAAVEIARALGLTGPPRRASDEERVIAGRAAQVIVVVGTDRSKG